MQIKVKEIGKFLKDLNEAERKYLEHSLNMSNSIKHLIDMFKLSKEQICLEFSIKPQEYKDFVYGNWNYDINQMGILNTLFMRLESEKLKEHVPCKIAGS